MCRSECYYPFEWVRFKCTPEKATWPMPVIVTVLLAFACLLPASRPTCAQPMIDRPRDEIAIAASVPAQHLAEALSAAFAIRMESSRPVVTQTPPHAAFAAFC